MKIIFSIYFLFTCLFSFAQGNIKENIISIASYEEQPILSQDAFKDVPEPYRAMVSKNTKPLPSYYELSFNNNEALYKKVQKKVEAPEDMNTGNIQMKQTVLSFGVTVEMYENYKTKKSVSSRMILDKEFLISEDLKKIDWKLINETKTIGGFICKKAQAKIGDDLVEAWYSPDVPTMAGPNIYWGLPGLIVELKSKSCHYIAIEIKENANGQMIPPTKGKQISKEEFKKLVDERLNDFKREHPNNFKVTAQ